MRHRIHHRARTSPWPEEAELHNATAPAPNVAVLAYSAQYRL